MTDQIITRFAEACGAAGPLALRVDLVDGGKRAEGSVPTPFALVGSDDACDVTLTDAEVNPRHAWFQVVGGRLLAVDLGSRTGLGWPNEGVGSGWLDAGRPVRIGPFLVQLCAQVSDRPVQFPNGYSPLQSDSAVPKSRVTTVLEFKNGKRAKDRWTVNRLVTLVGRAPECKIRLAAEDIAAYHCGLVLTPAGLWVVDLSGRGVVVNGERMRVSPLKHGSELWIGRFLIGLHATGPVKPGAASVPPAPAAGQPTQSGRAAAPGESADDDVLLGLPGHVESSGLPSSHILADAFQMWTATTASGVSNPILIAGSGAVSRSFLAPLAARPIAASAAGPGGSALSSGTLHRAALADQPERVDTQGIVSLLQELGELHGQMLSQFQESLGLMVKLFSCLGREQVPAIQRELARIQELNSELAELQAELARRAATAASPLERTLTASSAPTVPSAALNDWVAERIATLQRERETRWQSLVGLFTARNA